MCIIKAINDVALYNEMTLLIHSALGNMTVFN